MKPVFSRRVSPAILRETGLAIELSRTGRRAAAFWLKKLKGTARRKGPPKIWHCANLGEVARWLGVSVRTMRRIVDALRRRLPFEFREVFCYGKRCWCLLIALASNLKFDRHPLFYNRRGRYRHVHVHLREPAIDPDVTLTCRGGGAGGGAPTQPAEKQVSDIFASTYYRGSLQDQQLQDNRLFSPPLQVAPRTAEKELNASGHEPPPKDEKRLSQMRLTRQPTSKNRSVETKATPKKLLRVIHVAMRRVREETESFHVRIEKFEPGIFALCRDAMINGYRIEALTKSWRQALHDTRRDILDGLARKPAALLLWHARRRLAATDCADRTSRIRGFYAARRCRPTAAKKSLTNLPNPTKLQP